MSQTDPDDVISEGYSPSDAARMIAEPPKRAGRSAFARDRARVLHTAGLRRLAAKTQVMVAGESDFPRTRLTHTLEVAQIARELGEALGCDADLVDLAGLAHDLGHPPFGHNGEDALNAVAHDIGGFEGNAQSFRVLTRLEPKVFDGDGNSVGLNLTRASLDSSIKYPWRRHETERKFNVYADDCPIFDWVREGAVNRRQCFESQVMDWSDDVAYSVHDVEDGVHGGHIKMVAMSARAERDEVIALAQQRYAVGVEAGALEGALDRLTDLSYWPVSFDGSHRALAGLKNLTSQLVGRFVVAALAATREQFGTGQLNRYNADLIVPEQQRHEVAVLKALANVYVFQRWDAAAVLADQRQVIGDLVASLVETAPARLDPGFAASWCEATDEAGKLRAIIDQVASLTDRSVIRWHAAR